MLNNNITVHHGTPTITVLDNCNLTVRAIAYHCHPDTPAVTEERITHYQYDARGFFIQSADLRLYKAGLVNFTYWTDVTGNALRTQGVDDGTTVSLNDVAGRPFMTLSNLSITDDKVEDQSQTVIRTFDYEKSDLPGRLLSVTEQVNDEVVRITERFMYGGDTQKEKELNLAGQCVSHYDTAGLVQTDSVALTGVALSVTRQLLKDACNPDIFADWQGEDASAWNALFIVVN